MGIDYSEGWGCCQWRYDKVRNRVIEWELALNRLKEAAAARHVELCHVRAAVRSLYLKICAQKRMPADAPPHDFEQQLVLVMRALLELRNIYRIAHRRSKEKYVPFTQIHCIMFYHLLNCYNGLFISETQSQRKTQCDSFLIFLINKSVLNTFVVYLHVPLISRCVHIAEKYKTNFFGYKKKLWHEEGDSGPNPSIGCPRLAYITLLYVVVFKL